ncbi:MAG TPA: hypothetical protein VJW76_08890 [Verrucomicrobiae bacterium]|nr:hypothetical protein [Verrucomicrobiae bacterium]
MKTFTRFLLFPLVTLTLAPQSVRACATCFGASDADLARGMNWGIFSLLLVVVMVLGGIASFFVYLGRRSANLAAASAGHTIELSAPARPDRVETHK